MAVEQIPAGAQTGETLLWAGSISNNSIVPCSFDPSKYTELIFELQYVRTSYTAEPYVEFGVGTGSPLIADNMLFGTSTSYNYKAIVRAYTHGIPAVIGNINASAAPNSASIEGHTQFYFRRVNLDNSDAVSIKIYGRK
jgi:hypothetical protein